MEGKKERRVEVKRGEERKKWRQEGWKERRELKKQDHIGTFKGFK